MFRTYAESRGLTTPRTFTAALADFRKDSGDWFDGSLGSVDRRMSKCSKLIHSAQTAAASDPVTHLAAIAELSADHTALKNLREDLLTGASGREAGYTPPGQGLAKRLIPEDRRWVTLEGAKFFAAQDDARHNVAEMAERARRHAEVATSGLPPRRAQLLTAAFEEAIAIQARLTPRPRTASRRTVFADFPDSQMFL